MYILMINKAIKCSSIPLFSLGYFLKEMEKIFLLFLSSHRNTHKSLGELFLFLLMFIPCSAKINSKFSMHANLLVLKLILVRSILFRTLERFSNVKIWFYRTS